MRINQSLPNHDCSFANVSTKPRLVHVIGQLGRGGAEKQVFCLATALHRQGWEQAVISFHPGGVWENPLREAGIPVHLVPPHPLKPWRLWRLWRLVRHMRPGVLVSWSEHVAVYAQLLRGVGPVRRVFNMRADILSNCHTGRPRSRLGLMRHALEKAHFVVSNSRHNLDLAADAGLRLPPCRVIYNIVHAPGRARPAEPVPSPRIAGVGSLIPRKAYHVLLEALGLLASEGRRFELLLAGEGPERASLEDLARQLKIADRVTFLGDVDDVPGLLATAHLLAHPATSEGLSNTILEAMAEGLPVVACPVGATAEIIEPCQNGLLATPDNIESFASAIGRLIDNPVLRAKLGQAALKYVTQHLNESTITSQYENVFETLLRK